MKKSIKSLLDEQKQRFNEKNPVVRRFSKDTLHRNICKLKVGQSYVYPANGYFTMAAAARALGIFENKYFTQRSVNKTHKEITRLL